MTNGIFRSQISHFFYKNNFIRTRLKVWSKIKNNVRTIQVGIWKHKCKVCFSYNKTLVFSSNLTVAGVKLLQMLRSVELPLQFIGLDDHK